MDRLDDLLTASAPRVAASAELDRVTRGVARRPRAGAVIAGALVLSLAGGTAAAAGTGTLEDIVDALLGHPNDHAWEMDITGADGTFHCWGGIVVMPDTTRREYNDADYLAAKEFIQNHDWSGLKPAPELLYERERGTAEQLAITVDRSMSQVALVESGLPLTSISVRGTAECDPK